MSFDETYRAAFTFDTPSLEPGKEAKLAFEEVMGSRMAQNAARQATRTVTQQVIRGIFGILRGK
jgi:hypothetical protein